MEYLFVVLHYLFIFNFFTREKGKSHSEFLIKICGIKLINQELYLNKKTYISGIIFISIINIVNVKSPHKKRQMPVKTSTNSIIACLN